MLKIAFNKNYIYPLEENHRFPMIKYELIPEQLINEGTCSHNNFFIPKRLNKNHILDIHCKSYYEKLISLKMDKKEIEVFMG